MDLITWHWDITSVAARFPTHRHGSPKSLSWTILSPAGRRAGTDELKQETPCARRRQSVEAQLSWWSSRRRNAMGLLTAFPLINTSDEIDVEPQWERDWKWAEKYRDDLRYFWSEQYIAVNWGGHFSSDEDGWGPRFATHLKRIWGFPFAIF